MPIVVETRGAIHGQSTLRCRGRNISRRSAAHHRRPGSSDQEYETTDKNAAKISTRIAALALSLSLSFSFSLAAPPVATALSDPVVVDTNSVGAISTRRPHTKILSHAYARATVLFCQALSLEDQRVAVGVEL